MSGQQCSVVVVWVEILVDSCNTCNLCLYLNQVCKTIVVELFCKSDGYFYYCRVVVFSSIRRACAICARLRVGLPVLFRSGRGLRKNRQIKLLN